MTTREYIQGFIDLVDGDNLSYTELNSLRDILCSKPVWWLVRVNRDLPYLFGPFLTSDDARLALSLLKGSTPEWRSASSIAIDRFRAARCGGIIVEKLTPEMRAHAITVCVSIAERLPDEGV
jgi:hypothetical protein